MRLVKTMLAALSLAAFATAAVADTFPNKPVKIVMPYPPGTGPDAVMRMVAEKLSQTWKQQVIIDNKPGANGWIGVETVKRAPADGYTFLLIDQAIMSLHPYLYKKVPFDAQKDFEAVAPMYSTNYFVTIAAASKVNTYADLLAEARKRKTPLSYGSSGVGGQLHIGGVLTEAASGVPMSHVPYKDVGQMYVDVSQSTVDFAFATAATAGPLVKAGKLKLLAFAGPKRHPRFPNVPTVIESGGPADVQVSTWIALFAPDGTPTDIVSKVNTEVARIMASPEAQDYLANIGFIAWPGSAKELASVMKSDAAGYSDFVKKYKLSID
ncbi:Bug family tripartite tricarboxylate transporter substrate binding protein [Pseudaquabacterium rugosum]|jgi:tripartite-type tricarboxylate transporter receptor subunit TctC|uniref:Tripartite tricarboxylate transporter substrate binding protein n=1 Tax=Pseudaquabacterium rugosum TaxID=2984194 RepID=A0ABU9BGS2_9BURK